MCGGTQVENHCLVSQLAPPNGNILQQHLNLSWVIYPPEINPAVPSTTQLTPTILPDLIYNVPPHCQMSHVELMDSHRIYLVQLHTRERSFCGS